jgi:hypothetical protein
MIVAACLAVAAGPAAGQDLMIYPKDGQDKEQQELDEFQCYRWARDETGFDPMEVPTATEAPPQQEAKKGGVGRGAVRGAAVGGIIDGSDGAKTGAAAGALVGGMRRSEQAQIYAQNRNNYDRAYAACLDARGYTVR